MVGSADRWFAFQSVGDPEVGIRDDAIEQIEIALCQGFGRVAAVDAGAILEIESPVQILLDDFEHQVEFSGLMNLGQEMGDETPLNRVLPALEVEGRLQLIA